MAEKNDSFGDIILDLSKEKRRRRLTSAILIFASISAVFLATALFFFSEHQKNQPKEIIIIKVENLAQLI